MVSFFSLFVLSLPLWGQDPLWITQSQETLAVTILIEQSYPWTAQDSLLVEEAMLEIQSWYHRQTAGWTILLDEPVATLRIIPAYPAEEDLEEGMMREDSPKTGPVWQTKEESENAPADMTTPRDVRETTGPEEDWTWWYRVRQGYFQQTVASPRRPRVVFSSLESPTLGGEQNGFIVLSREVLDGITGRPAPRGRSFYLGVVAHEILHATGPDHPEAQDGSLISLGHNYFPYTYISRESMEALIGSPFMAKINPRIAQLPQDQQLYLNQFYGIRQRLGDWELFDLQSFRWLPATSTLENEQIIALTAGDHSFVFYKDTREFWLQKGGVPKLLGTLHPHPWVRLEEIDHAQATGEKEEFLNEPPGEINLEGGM
jgi:hypothetical protein